ncbi:serine/threonine-protein kinase [Anaeromyxobacter paludicola]|uniref:Protein kinase domain-containing protein n=1 Tax=Anaeromyxobacter paludicola TaxID=2918171 RepID=A0ABM7XC19_9BACT|nr:serine/threonine-protein kinase [Anaeromyxobacter paludicola]BDG09394.1 hypothetical protein AMPC_25070 [Anaeromyxobacter paludicola]
MSDGGASGGRRGSALSRLLEELARVEEADLPDRFAPGLPPGAAVGRFRVERELGRGGFGVVYAARDPELGRTVALKLLKPGSRVARSGEEWIRREAEAVARLNHPGIVTLHDFGRAPEGAYLVFELLQGETLAERSARGRVALDEALRIGAAVAEALAHAHAAEVLHRDLKPGNVYLCGPAPVPGATPPGGGPPPVVKVLDFGVAHLFGGATEPSGGTPGYMAPEQRAGGAVDARADLYALGVVLHELLSGAPPSCPDARTAALAPLPRGAGPAGLRRLVAALTAHDPGRRPRTAAEVARALERLRRDREGRWRRRLLAGLGLATGAALAVAGWAVLLGREAAPGERVTAVVADAENRTGDPDLDRLGDGVRALLGESRRIEPLTRDRLAAVARQAGLAPPARLDPAQARELGRLAGASVLLLPAARAEGGALRLSLRAAAPDDGRTLFEVAEEARGKGEVPAAIDRLLAKVRSRLRERREDLRASPIQLARVATGDLTAYRHYLEGLDCIGRPSAGPANTALATCGPHFSQAIARDPAFPLAHYHLAVLLGLEGTAPAEIGAHMDAALAGAGRLSPRDATLVRAWKAHLDGRDDEAERAYDQLVAASPDDRELLYLAGDLRFHRSERVGAIPYFQKLLALDPEAEWPLEHLMECYAVTGRTRELTAMVAELRALPRTPERSRVLIRALAWLEQPEEAVAAARRAAADRIATGEADLRTVLLAAGRYREVEPLMRARTDFDAAGGGAYIWLANVLMAQGRNREATQILDELQRRVQGMPPSWPAFFKATLAAGVSDATRLSREAAEAVELVRASRDGFGQRDVVAVSALLLALRGDPARARELEPLLPNPSTARAELEALLRWRAGDGAGAVAALTAIEADDSWPECGIAPAYLLAEVSASQGEWGETAAAVRRFQRLWPRGFWRGWAWPRALYLSAEAHARLGERETARAELARLLELLQRADPGLPLRREALALSRTLR